MIFSRDFGRHSKTVDYTYFSWKSRWVSPESPVGTLKQWIEWVPPECPVGTLNSGLYCFFVKKWKIEGVTTILKVTAGSQFETSRYTFLTVLFIKNHHFSPVILKFDFKKSKMKSWERGAQNVWTSRENIRATLIEGPRNVWSVSKKSRCTFRWGVSSPSIARI